MELYETIIEDGIKVYKDHFCHCPCHRRILWHKSDNRYGIPKYIRRHKRIKTVDDLEHMNIVLNAKIVVINGIEFYENNYCKCCGNRIQYKDFHKYYGIPEYVTGHQCKINSPLKLGCSFSPEMRKNMSIAHSGANNSNYIDGRSFLPYCEKFNETLKRSVRDRDNYTCQLCGKTQEENGRKLDVHHVHYDKQNCYPDLITLCMICNVKVNKNRLYYESLFMNKLNDRCLLFWTRRIE